MILNAETREQRSAGGAVLEPPPRQDTLTFFQGSALNYGNYLDEVWVIDDRQSVTVAQLNDGSGSQRHFYHCNTLYHVYALTDETGAIAEAVQSYDAYGKISALITGSGTDTTWFTSDDVLATNPNMSTIGNPWFYAGQRIDPETGLGYHKNRFFMYDLGRWATRDPIGYEAESLGLYEYVGGKVTRFTDSLGLKLTVDNKGARPRVKDLLNELCPEGKWKISDSGEVYSEDIHFCYTGQTERTKSCGTIVVVRHDTRKCELTEKPISCCCICDAIRLDRKININVSIFWRRQNVDTTWGGGVASGDRTEVTVSGNPNPGVAGQGDTAAPGAGLVRFPVWLILGHELCGHAVPDMGHAPGGPYSLRDPVIWIENQIRGEHSTEADNYGVRGTP